MYFLYECEITNPGKESHISSSKMLELMEAIGVDKKIMQFSIFYLRDKKLLTLYMINGDWASAKITARGIDHHEKS